MTASEIVTAFIRALEEKDYDAALGFASEEIEYDNVPIGAVQGHEGVRTTLGPFLAGFDQVEWVVYHQVAEEDGLGGAVVMNERLDRFHGAAGWVELKVAGLFRLEEDKIVLWRDYFDLGALQQALAPS